MKKENNPGISFFQRYLTVWVSIPMAVLIWVMIYPMMLKVDFQSVQNVGKNPKGLFVTWVVNWLIGIFFVNMSLCFSEGRADTLFHLIQKSSLERLAEKGVAEIFNDTPEAIIGETAFRDETMNMRVPFQGASESMKDTDKTGNKVF